MTKAFRGCGLEKGFTPPPAVTGSPNGAEPWRLCNITIGMPALEIPLVFVIVFIYHICEKLQRNSHFVRLFDTLHSKQQLQRGVVRK